MEGCLELLQRRSILRTGGQAAVPVTYGTWKEGAHVDLRLGPDLFQVLLCSRTQVASGVGSPQFLIHINKVRINLEHEREACVLAT